MSTNKFGPWTRNTGVYPYSMDVPMEILFADGETVLATQNAQNFDWEILMVDFDNDNIVEYRVILPD